MKPATSVAAVVLAAGGSTRLGRPKQLLLYKGSTLVRRAVEAALASGAAKVVVVVGAVKDEVKRALDGLDVHVVENEAWATGMGSSIAVAMTALAGYDAAIVTTCDQPAVTGAHLAALVERYECDDVQIVASMYKETLGVPALFAASVFSELAALEAAGGAKAVIGRDLSRVAAVALDGGEVDIDTEADYARLRER